MRRRDISLARVAACSGHVEIDQALPGGLGPSQHRVDVFAELAGQPGQHRPPRLRLRQAFGVGVEPLAVRGKLGADVRCRSGQLDQALPESVQLRVVAGLLRERPGRLTEQAADVRGIAGRVVGVAEQRIVRRARSQSEGVGVGEPGGD